MKRIFAAPLLVLLISPSMSWAQSSDAEELDIIEVELENATQPAPPPPPPAMESRVAPEEMPPETRPIDFQGLGQLAPFAEVSVMQRRYMPKTGRFQLFGGGTMVTNDPFFNVIGGVAKAGYFFTESMGLELSYFGLSTSDAKATQELKKVQGVITDNLVATKSVLALDFMFVPIYGKMTWFNNKIIPFDLYFSVGGGTTKTQAEDAGTLHLAAGQIFSLSKSTGFRWDFSWNFFNATGVDGNKGSYNNLFLTVGWSWFFPEAQYR